MNSLRYLDVAELIGFAGSSSMITLIASIYMISMSLLYIVSYFDKYVNPKSKPRKYFYGRWFVNMANYFTQVLIFPFSIIFLTFILCTDEILLDQVAMCSFSGSNKSYYALTFSFSLIGFLLLLFNEWWL